LQVTVMPVDEEPEHIGVAGVVHPPADAAAFALGHAPPLATVAQYTIPGATTHTSVAMSHTPWIPELPHQNVPSHGPVVSVLSHAPFDELSPGTATVQADAARRVVAAKMHVILE
jgi:hypothetical protein